jgi:hypothetical protein
VEEHFNFINDQIKTKTTKHHHVVFSTKTHRLKDTEIDLGTFYKTSVLDSLKMLVLEGTVLDEK